MSVYLLTSTDPMLLTLYTAAHGCQSPYSAAEIFVSKGRIGCRKENPTDLDIENNMRRVIYGCILRDHNTVLRQASFTWSVGEVSRVASAQLTRHAAGITWDQQSQRVVPLRKSEDIECDPLALVIEKIPFHKAKGDDHLQRDVQDHLDDTKLLYDRMVAAGIHPEEARRILPMGIASRMTCTATLASLIHLWKVRVLNVTGRTQDETGELVAMMVQTAVAKEPWLKMAFDRFDATMEDLRNARED